MFFSFSRTFNQIAAFNQSSAVDFAKKVVSMDPTDRMKLLAKYYSSIDEKIADNVQKLIPSAEEDQKQFKTPPKGKRRMISVPISSGSSDNLKITPNSPELQNSKRTPDSAEFLNLNKTPDSPEFLNLNRTPGSSELQNSINSPNSSELQNSKRTLDSAESRKYSGSSLKSELDRIIDGIYENDLKIETQSIPNLKAKRKLAPVLKSNEDCEEKEQKEKNEEKNEENEEKEAQNRQKKLQAENFSIRSTICLNSELERILES